MMRIKLRIHYLMCSFCERYMKQLKYIREVSREFPEKIGEVSGATMSTEAKERMKAALRQYIVIARPGLYHAAQSSKTTRGHVVLQ